MTKEHAIFIPHLAESLNKFMSRKNKGFGSKTQVKNAIKNFAKTAFDDLEEIEKPIEIEWIPVLSKPKNHVRKKRGYDVLNYSHQYKYTEDQLTELKKIADDGNRFVKRHILNTPIFVSDNEVKGIIVLIREIEENDIQEMEETKLKIFEKIRPQIKSEEENVQDYAINFFKDRE